MSWDDEDFDVPTTAKDSIAESWEDEAADDDEPLLESWDAEPAEKPKKDVKKPAKPAKKVAKSKKKAAGGEKKLLPIDTADEATRRKMLKEAQRRSDMANAEELFAGLGVTDKEQKAAATADDDDAELDEFLEDDEDEEPVEQGVVLTIDTPLSTMPIFNPEDRSGYEKLRRSLTDEMTRLAAESKLNYASALAQDLISDMCEPMTIEQVRKVISTLNAKVTKKVREERQARMKKTGDTATGGAGKKKAKGNNLNLGGSFKKDSVDDMLNDDFGDDDFM